MVVYGVGVFPVGCSQISTGYRLIAEDLPEALRVTVTEKPPVWTNRSGGRLHSRDLYRHDSIHRTRSSRATA